MPVRPTLPSRSLAPALLLAAALWSAPAWAEFETELLAVFCAACHGTDGNSIGVATPTIASLSPEYLVDSMIAYKTKTRRSTVMGRIAKGYSDADIDKLLICQALMEGREAEISLSPGFRWGATLLPGQDITMDDVYNQTAITYPAAYHMAMTGVRIRDILEDVADNLFNPNPYYQQGGDMVPVGGLGYAIDVSKPMGQRIGAMTLLRTGKAIDASASYAVAGWASVNEGTEGPPVFDLVRSFIERRQVVNIPENETVKVSGL
ncbi:hypothetical protein N825_02660 [Skermanella stibiiresistens SB22]|uniref:5'-Nucleotidase C-terminal domain-containing protein n=1 Tax=Skermanella stibiiresistens SB22 TaxID=1385369 RepID=W9HDV3_9PROT|nr:5'-nucleotidase C-terminal domain-containing protein [Skermanella stibiiresistens]EWY42887.1 hypothetical protein N825_02660 [Skermanella stibiiresistens SB22]